MISFRLFIILLLLGCLKTYHVESSLCFGCLKPKTSDETSSDQPVSAKLKKDFKEIDAVLVRRVQSNNGPDNMKVIERLVASHEAGKKEKRIEALKIILSLKELTDSRNCYRKGYKIVLDAIAGIDQEPHLKRLELVFYHYLKQQESVCMRVFPDILKSKLRTMDEGKVERLDYLVEQCMNRAKEGTEVERLFTLLKNDNVGPEPSELERALSNLPLVSPNPGEMEQCSGDKGKLQKLAKTLQERTILQYLIEPCKYYIQQLGPDMFDLATTWIVFHQPDIYQNQFYRSWVRFQFCRNFFDMAKSIRQS